MHRLGTIVLVLVVSAVVVVQGVSVLLNWAADDVRLQIGIITGRDRTPAGVWLSSALMADLPVDDAADRHARADYFDQLSDRLREMAGASALAGLLIAPVTAKGDQSTLVRGWDEARPAAKTISNGTA
jgi:hypothetical protein